MKNRHTAVALAVLSAMSLPPRAYATSFEITDGQTVTAPQNLTDNEVGDIRAGGTLSTGSSRGVSIDSATSTLRNAGTITTSGAASQGIYLNLVQGASALNSGTITTTGAGSHGVEVAGSGATIVNSGTISATGSGSHAIQSSGDVFTLNNSGTLTAAGSGISSSGVASRLSNSGTITATGSGIASSGTATTLNNSGTITAAGSGISLSGAVTTLTNSGSITASGSGIASSGAATTLTNSGSITATGSGVSSSGDTMTLTNSGSITATGSGISSSGAATTLTNSGTITSSTSFGIQNTGLGARITNSGTINAATTGISAATGSTVVNSGTINAGSSGILNAGTGSTTSNSGSVVVTGGNSVGISTGAGGVINNTGLIRVTGDSALGVLASPALYGSVLNNSGTIVTSGDNSVAIRFGANVSTINNSGTVIATGNAAYAVLGSNTKQTLNLYPGSRMVGAIDLTGTGDGDTVNVYGTQGSAVLNLQNVENVNVYMPNAVAIGTSKVVVVEPTGESARGASLGQLTQGIHNVVNQRGAGLLGFRTTQVAAGELEPGMVPLERRPVLWMQLLGVQGDRSQVDAAPAYRYNSYGLVAGHEREIDAATRAGLLGGVATGQVNSSSQRNSSDSLYGGLYAERQLAGVKLGTALIAGMASNNNQRDVVDNTVGTETASARNMSYFLSPSFTLSTRQSWGADWELRPSAQLVYGLGYYTGYTESGTSSGNLQVDAHRVQSLLGRLQLEGARKNEQGEWSVRGGWQLRRLWGDAVNMSIDGYTLNLVNASAQTATGPYAGLGVQYKLTGRLNLLGDVEYARLDSSETQLSARATLQFLF